MTRKQYWLLGAGAVLFQVLVIVYWAVRRGVQTPVYFAGLGAHWATPFGLSGTSADPAGYDGQFFYYMARFPGHLPHAFDLPGLRYGRVLYPLLAGVVSFGQSALLPWGLLAVSVLAVAATTVLLARMLVRIGAPPLVALVALIYCGQTLPLLEDLADPLAVLFMVAALSAALDRRWMIAAACCALGALTRETDLVVTLALLISLAIAGEVRLGARFAAVALLPVAAWHGFLFLWLHDAGLSESIHAPFTQPSTLVVLLIAGFALLPVLAGLVASGVTLVRRTDVVVPLCALGFGALFALQPADHWADPRAVFRVAAPVVILLPLLLRGRARLQAGLIAVCAGSMFVVYLAAA